MSKRRDLSFSRRDITLVGGGVREVHHIDNKLYEEVYTFEEWRDLLLECHSDLVCESRRNFYCKHKCRKRDGQPFKVQKLRLNTHRWHGCPNHVDAEGRPIPEKMYPNLLYGNSTVLRLREGKPPQVQIMEYIKETDRLIKAGMGGVHKSPGETFAVRGDSSTKRKRAIQEVTAKKGGRGEPSSKARKVVVARANVPPTLQENRRTRCGLVIPSLSCNELFIFSPLSRKRTASY